jgi:hypothetical protein
MIGGTEDLGEGEPGRRGLDELGLDRRRENACHRRPQLLWTPHLAVFRRDVVRQKWLTILNQRVPGSSPGAHSETRNCWLASRKAVFAAISRVCWPSISGLCAETIVFRPLLARLSPAAKIPFQTRIGQADRKCARGVRLGAQNQLI